MQLIIRINAIEDDNHKIQNQRLLDENLVRIYKWGLQKGDLN
jgi:hypothetical protein